jgi:hypothetical protein
MSQHEIELEPVPFGPTAAAILAAGVGCWVFGLLVALAGLSQGIAQALTFSPRVGPLSGEATVASVAYFASWKGLAWLWKRRDLPERRTYVSTAVLVLVGILLALAPVLRAG